MFESISNPSCIKRLVNGNIGKLSCVKRFINAFTTCNTNKINQSIKIIRNTQNIFVANDGIKIYELRYIAYLATSGNKRETTN